MRSFFRELDWLGFVDTPYRQRIEDFDRRVAKLDLQEGLNQIASRSSALKRLQDLKAAMTQSEL